MPNLTSKKTKTINSNSLIKNQISNILQPVNGTVNINVQKTNTISTQSAASQSYYIPLLEKITGEQSINVKVPLSFNATTNTLSVPNLTISNLPTCNVDASNSSNSSNLVNKSYANTYAYFDLSGGYRWECEDWISGTTKGKYNWVYTSGFSWQNSGAGEIMSTYLSNHIGVVQISTTNTIGPKRIQLPIVYNSNKIKLMRFIVNLSNDANSFLTVGFFDNATYLNNTVMNSNTNYFLYYNYSTGLYSGINNTLVSIPNSPKSIDSKWVLFEIEQSSTNKITFYITNLTSGTSRTVHTRDETIGSYDGYIYINYRVTSGTRTFYVDYVDWVVSS